MKKIKLPERFNYAEAFLTFRCNLGCGYCINKHSGLVERKELTAEEWIEGLNRIDFGDVPLTLGGGEPTLHDGFYDVVNGTRKEVNLDLLTNATFHVVEFINKVDVERFRRKDNPAYKPIRVSFHPTKMYEKRLGRKVKQLQEAGFGIGIFGINHPLNLVDNVRMAELCRMNGVYFFIKDFLGTFDGQLFGYYKYPEGVDGITKEVECRTRELLIAPDGNVFRCHRDLYHNEGELGNILDKDFEIRDEFRKCGNYGDCNPCDVKMKTNRFLQMGNCSVEVRKINEKEK